MWWCWGKIPPSGCPGKLPRKLLPGAAVSTAGWIPARWQPRPAQLTWNLRPMWVLLSHMTGFCRYFELSFRRPMLLLVTAALCIKLVQSKQANQPRTEPGHRAALQVYEGGISTCGASVKSEVACNNLLCSQQVSSYQQHLSSFTTSFQRTFVVGDSEKGRAVLDQVSASSSPKRMLCRDFTSEE